MYNLDFIPQLEASIRHIFGYLEPREAIDRINNYIPSKDIVILECVEDINGEWVPGRSLEQKVPVR